MLFRVVFHTAFIRGHDMMLTRDEVDLNVDARDPMPKDFKAEVRTPLTLTLTFSMPKLEMLISIHFT